jgi:eukaryotic-like serine/threonine-protein kinase
VLAGGATVLALAAVIGLISLNQDDPESPSTRGAEPQSATTQVAPTSTAAETASPTAATTRATPSAAATSARPSASPGSAALPAGFRLHRDPTGFTVAVPRGWTRSKRGTSVFFRDPGGSSYLQVDTTTKPKPDALKDWRKQEASVARRFPGYQRLRLERVNYRGWNAADWEFTWRSGGTVHVLNRNIRVNNRRAYALYWSVPANEWVVRRNDFNTVAATFAPA